MGKGEKKNIPLWAETGHRAPVTRREFLASGIIPFSASLILPNWVGLMLPSEAKAAGEACPSQSSGMIPLVSLNLSGGAGLSGNFVPMDAGGQLLPSYDLMGLGDNQVPIAREFGNVPFAGVNPATGQLISKVLQGIRQMAPNAIAGTSFVGVCVRSRDDSGDNRFSIDGLTTRAGLVGSLLPNLGNRSNSITGVNQKPALVSPPSPLIVNSFSALSGALGYAGAIGATLTAPQKLSLSRLIASLSQSQSAKLAALQTDTQVKTVLDCAGIKNVEANSKSSPVDPRVDATYGAQLNTLWGINAATAANNQQLIFASSVYNVIQGTAGSASLEIGGYDYHNNTRTTGDQKDLEAGQAIGRILQSAFIMKKPLFLYVTSDGSVTSAKSNARDSVWASDRGSAGLAYMIYYDPNGRRATKNFQMGHYTSGQSADDKFVIGNNPELAAAAVFANYLQLNNKLDMFSSIAKTNALTAANLNQVLMFA